MHFETTERGFNIYMEKSMEPKYREGDFDFKASGREAGASNEPRDGKDQALTLVVGFSPIICLVFCLVLREVYAQVLGLCGICLEYSVGTKLLTSM